MHGDLSEERGKVNETNLNRSIRALALVISPPLPSMKGRCNTRSNHKVEWVDESLPIKGNYIPAPCEKV